jgi:molybdopterin converting factor small subunit
LFLTFIPTIAEQQIEEINMGVDQTANELAQILQQQDPLEKKKAAILQYVVINVWYKDNDVPVSTKDNVLAGRENKSAPRRVPWKMNSRFECDSSRH